MAKAPRRIPTDFLSRIKAERRANHRFRQALPPERIERFARWWEWRIMGLSIHQIVKQENGKFTRRQIEHGLQTFVNLAEESIGRPERLARHLAFIDACKAKCAAELAKLEKLDRGVAVETVTFNKLGQMTGRKVKYESALKAKLDILESMRRWDQYAATIEGVMDARIEDGIEDKVDAIDVEFSTLLSHDEGEPHGEESDGPAGFIEHNGRNGHSGTNGTSPHGS